MNGVELKKNRLKKNLTQEKLAELIGVDKKTIINYENGGNIPRSKYTILQSVLGNPLNAYKMEDNDSSSLVREEAAAYSVSPKFIPLIPIDAMAGFASGEKQVVNYSSENYLIPNFSGADYLIMVKGTSMSPKYNSGDIVACKKLSISDVFFQWKKVYVLDTEQGALIKRISKGSSESTITLESYNEEYPPFELKLSQINAIALVIGLIRLE